MNKELLEQAQPMSPTFKEDLSAAIEKLKILNEGEKIDWTTTKKFQEIIKKMGEHYPIALLEALVSHYKEVRQKIIIQEIPELLNGAGLSEITTDDGYKVTLKTEYSPKVIDKINFYEWLSQNGYEDEIKEKYSFGKGEAGEELDAFLEENGFSYEKAQEVAYQTVKRIITNRVKEGEDFPPDNLCKVSIVDIAKVKGV